ncbi:hypothetical protein [Frankia sp. CeD]|uniref:hypothetical protein n=1 Tax=Frankia sp. CeD TaxID=258230 RepID=UPI0004DCD6E2|nr:hypothetical protein [Frankia sp. CeD]KEZ35846.1 hypothetical protein CEDDRAFT_02842 [Frankia sp. CeD]
MAENRARKRAIRARMAETGEPYTVAMRAVDAEHARGEAMATHHTRPVEIDAVHWTGSNRAELEELAGNPVTVQPDGGAMFWGPAGSVWMLAGSWLVRRGDQVEVLDDATFTARYEPAGYDSE